MTHAGGRPKLFTSVEEMQKKIDEYFAYCDNRVVQGYDNKTNEQFAYVSPEPYTMSGLAYYLGMDRRSLINYKNDQEFFPTIKAARDRVEMDIDRRLNDKGTFTPGLIFNLKNNFGWKDQTQQDITSGGKPILGGQTHVQDHNSDPQTDETPQQN
jgi:hypothetical protein